MKRLVLLAAVTALIIAAFAWLTQTIKEMPKAVAMPSDHETFYLLAEAPADPVDPRVELLAAALHDRGGCEDEWPTCAISTLEHYRNAARNLLPILDAAGADQ